MAYCTNCGNIVEDNAKFCGNCGAKMVASSDIRNASNANAQQPKAEGTQRETVFEGKIHKCPNCGAILSAFMKNCPECGYELRGSLSVHSVRDFNMLYSSATTNSQKIDLIRTFAIPNTKEDILEFVILASSNIDTSSYTRDTIIVSGGVSQQDIVEAWMAKLEQAYQKATILLSDSPELKSITKLYEEKTKNLERSRNAVTRRKSSKTIISVVLGILSITMLTLGFTVDGLAGLGLVGMLAGLAIFFINN